MASALPSAACTACQAPLPPGARFCSQCSFPVAGIGAPAARPVGWYYNTWFVLSMLFLVLGPFGLPLVWKHPRWSRPVKSALTVVVLAYTIWLLQLTFHTAQVVLQHFQQLGVSF